MRANDLLNDRQAKARAATPDGGFSKAIPNIASAMLVAAMTELGLMAILRDELELPSSAQLTAYFVFGVEESWWGSLPDLPFYFVPVHLAAGVFVADRVNKLPMELSFLLSSFGIFALTAFLGNASAVQAVFRSPDANAVLFFALFMLDDPPTSPTKYRDQDTYGAIAALISYAVFMVLGGVYYLLAGVLFANAWESLRRIEERSAKESKRQKPTREGMATDLTHL